jgi:hypothetical protein
VEHNLEFRNFERNGKYISANMYLDGKFIVKFTDSIEHTLKQGDTKISLYEFFKLAVKAYLSDKYMYTIKQYNTSIETVH